MDKWFTAEAHVRQLESGKYKGFISIAPPASVAYSAIEIHCEHEHDTFDGAVADADVLAEKYRK